VTGRGRGDRTGGERYEHGSKGTAGRMVGPGAHVIERPEPEHYGAGRPGGQRRIGPGGVTTSPDWLAVRGLYGDAILPRESARAEIPPEALQPWPGRPPYSLCEAQPGRWAQLRAARDPAPELFEGTDGIASWNRAMGWPVERALRESPADCWWFDPALPLACCMGGFPDWNGHGERPDTGEDAEEFARLVREYGPEIAAGAVFRPLVVYAVEPAADRPATGLQR
jgi:hypothetical protein